MDQVPQGTTLVTLSSHTNSLEHFQRGCTFSGEITCQGTTSVVPKRLDENQFLAAAGRRAAKGSGRKRGYTNIETGLVTAGCLRVHLLTFAHRCHRCF